MSKSIEKTNQDTDLQIMPKVEPVGGDVLEQLKVCPAPAGMSPARSLPAR